MNNEQAQEYAAELTEGGFCPDTIDPRYPTVERVRCCDGKTVAMVLADPFDRAVIYFTDGTTFTVSETGQAGSLDWWEGTSNG